MPWRLRSSREGPSVDIADAQYVSITTYRSNGDGVSNPVWITDLQDGTIGFTTASSSHKVGRLRSDPRIMLTPCDMRGNVDPDAGTIEGTVELVDGPGYERVRERVAAEYGMQYRAMTLLGKAARLVGRGSGTDTGVVITPESREV